MARNRAMTHSNFFLRCAFAVVLSFGAAAKAQIIPKGFVVPDCTISPDGRLGVTVPVVDVFPDSETPKNTIIDLKTGRTIGRIKTRWTAWNYMNHGDILPLRWSADQSLLLWEFDGKWFRDAVVLLKFHGKRIEWQTDITVAAYDAILSRTRQAAPEKFAAAKKANQGDGEAYPEKFTIEVFARNPIAFPLKIQVALTSNPKQSEEVPQLGSELMGIVDNRGKFKVSSFRLKDNAYEELEEQMPHPEGCPRDCAAEERARR